MLAYCRLAFKDKLESTTKNMNLAHNSPHSADSPVTKYSTLPSLQYLRQTKLKIYINEALSALLAQASAQGHENGGVNGGGNSGGVKGIDVGKRPLRFLSNHFECVVRKVSNF